MGKGKKKNFSLRRCVREEYQKAGSNQNNPISVQSATQKTGSRYKPKNHTWYNTKPILKQPYIKRIIIFKEEKAGFFSLSKNSGLALSISAALTGIKINSIKNILDCKAKHHKQIF